MFKRLFILILIVFATVPALAQTPPDPINAALQDLGNRVNRTVTLTQVTEWNYQQSVYPSPALGCPQPGISYTDVLTAGFQFIITYEGTVYDYRVSDDESIVVLCGTAPAPATVPPCPPSNDPAFITPRLNKGIQARVIAEGLPNMIREQPGSSSKLLGQIPAGDPFIVLDGPRCTMLDKIVWWQINYNNLIGWTGEGQDGTYWLEPTDVALTPTVPAPENVAITTDNADQLNVSTTVEGPLALSPDGNLYASAKDNMVVVKNLGSQVQATSFDLGSGKATSLAFNTTGVVLAAGLETGEIRLLDLTAQSNSTEIRRMTGHTGAVNAVAFSPNGTLLASSSADKTLRIWDVGTGESIITLRTNEFTFTSLTFTADGIYLVAHDPNGATAIYTVNTVSVG